jgi:hypothetical protein
LYATIVRCERHPATAAFARGQAGRALIAALAALPGFIAVVAIETDAASGTVTAVCLIEKRAGLADIERVLAQWQHEQVAIVRSSVQQLGAGEVIAQWGL